MGDEISRIHFTENDFLHFKDRLRAETALLRRWFDERRFAGVKPVCGLELEAWLTDEHYLPVAKNVSFLKALNHPLVGTELSQFNFELNSTPVRMDGTGDCLHRLHEELTGTWAACSAQATKMGLKTLAIGCIPTLRDGMLTLGVISKEKRYRAMNEQLFAQRGDEPMDFHIEEGEGLHIEKADIMLEAAATSLQIHYQVDQPEAARVYNASIIASAPLVAAAANSPYLYGKQLWDETRIAIFERAVPGGNLRGPDGHVVRRVGFGSGYARHSLLEPFLENLDGYPPILPVDFHEPDEKLAHLRLHNGTIWRWNRPLVGFDPETDQPSLRIEHRTMSAGPTTIDTMANIAFYLGLARGLSNMENPPELALPFEQARDNFYQAAIGGLNADVSWIDGRQYTLRDLCLKEFLPLARRGLQDLQVDAQSIALYIDETLAPRIESGQNGAQWQKAFIQKHGKDFTAMTKTYAANRESGQPVWKWDLS